MQAMSFDTDGVTDRPADAIDQLRTARDAPEITWVRATGASADELERVAEAFDLHALTVEDVRPKTDRFSDYTFTLLKDAELRGREQVFADELADEALDGYVGEGLIVTLSTAEISAEDTVWRMAIEEDRRILERKADFAAYRVIDRPVDAYFEILDGIESDIELLEEAVLESTQIETLEAITGVRRDLLAFRKLAWPSREAVGVLARGDPDPIHPETEKYFRDVADHLVQVVDLIETDRDLTSGARDIRLNTVSQSTNEVMKVLPVVATIFIPLTFVVEIYGMNFDTGPLSMPELGWTWAYPAVLLGMVAIVTMMLWYFRAREWL